MATTCTHELLSTVFRARTSRKGNEYHAAALDVAKTRGASAECLLQHFLAVYSTPRPIWHTLDLVWANWLQSRCKNNLILTLHVASTRASIGNWRCLKGGKGSASLFPFWFIPVSYYHYYFILLVLYFVLLRPCPLGLISNIGASCPVIIQVQRDSVLLAVVVERELLQTLSVVAATILMLLLRYDVHSGPTVFLCQGCTTTLHCFGWLYILLAVASHL